MTTKTVDDYLALITPYHRQAPNFSAVVALAVQPNIGVQALLESLTLAFDLDDAIGVQLDAVGVRVGISRDLAFPLPENWFSFGDPARGWGVGVWKGPYGNPDGVTTLNDDVYRLLIRAKILANACDGSLYAIQQILTFFFAQFGSALVWVEEGNNLNSAQPGDMTYSFCFAGTLPPIEFMTLISRNVLPLKTAGVKVYSFESTVDGAPLFGFGVQNQYVAGWGTGAWGADPDVIGLIS